MDAIEAIETTAVAVPLDRPVRSCVRVADEAVLVITRVRCSHGDGVSFVSAFTPSIAHAVRSVVAELATWLVGEDAASIESVNLLMRRALRLIGLSGPSATAMAGVDLALWDLKGRTAGVPVHELLGSTHDDLEAYASDGCWLESSGQVAAEAAAAADSGFDTIKIRLGREHLDADLEVLRNARSAVGERVAFIADVNQGWDLQTTLSAIPRLVAHGVRWLEEPLPAFDFVAYAELASQADIRLIVGESVFERKGLAELAGTGGVHLLTPDLQRLGGVTGWRRAVQEARSDVPRVGSHLYPEFSVHMLAAEPDPGPVEWVGWHQRFVSAPTAPAAGRIRVPDEPGFGLEYDWEAVAHFALDRDSALTK